MRLNGIPDISWSQFEILKFFPIFKGEIFLNFQTESAKIRNHTESPEIQIQTESKDLFLFHYNDTKFVKFMIDEKSEQHFPQRRTVWK